MSIEGENIPSTSQELFEVIDAVRNGQTNEGAPSVKGSVRSVRSTASARARREAEAAALRLEQLKRRCALRSKALDMELELKARKQNLDTELELKARKQKLEMELELKLDEAQEEFELAEFAADTVSEFDSCESSHGWDHTPIKRPNPVVLVEHAKVSSKAQGYNQEVTPNIYKHTEALTCAQEEQPSKAISERTTNVNSTDKPLAPAKSQVSVGPSGVLTAKAEGFGPVVATCAEATGAGTFEKEHQYAAIKPCPHGPPATPENWYVIAETIKQGFNLPKLSLMKYDGDPINYHKFMNHFDRQINKAYLSDAEKLGYLCEFCTENALTNILECKSMPPELGYREALDILHRRHGRLDLVVRAHMDRLTQRPQLKDSDFQGLRQFRAQAAESYKLFSQWDCKYTLDLPQNVEAVVQRLPQRAIRRFITKSSELRLRSQPVTFQTLLDLLELLVEDTLSPMMRFVSDEERKSKSQVTNKGKFPGRVAAAYSAVSGEDSFVNHDLPGRTLTCPQCGSSHFLWKCEAFKSQPVKERHALVRRNKLCFNCFRPEHCAGECTSNYVCRVDGCGKRHHTLLHWAQLSGPSGQSSSALAGVDGSALPGISAATLRTHSVRLKVVPVTVLDKDCKPHFTHAFLDDGSDTSLCSAALAKKLGLSGVEDNLTITTVNGTQTLRSRKVSLSVQGLNDGSCFLLKDVRVVPKLPNLQGSIPTVDDIKRYPHIRDLKFSTIDCPNVDLLVAADVYEAHEQHEAVRGSRGDPVAIRTGLGWCLFGPGKKQDTENANVNHIHADIKGMFHQVRVLPEDCDSLRFLWWPNGDTSLPPVDYQMLVHLFGATSSPSCASFALRKAALDQKDMFSHDAIETILKNFYVDDCLKSASSVTQATALIRDITEVLREGGFHLTKFLSNSTAVLESVNEPDRSSAVLNLDLSDLPSEKTLGIQWNMANDSFGVRVNIKQKPHSRRGMLSMISQVYDPLGFIQPFMLPMKRLMQSLCNQQLDWDDPLPESAVEHWNLWLDHVPLLKNVSIPRGYKPPNAVIVSTQLHCFGDACETGFGAVCYLRFVDSNGNIHCSLVLGKSRVTPLKPVTIPRLELVAAVTTVKLGTMIVQELDYDVDNVLFWSDSTTVLHYIHNTARRFQTFVANRLAIIHEHSRPSQWRHVGSKDNPADIASRGLMPNEFVKARQWFRGPDFLWNSQDSWPDQPAVFSAADTDLEIKSHTICTTKVTANDTPLQQLLQRFSSWDKLQKSIAWLSRFKDCVLWKYDKNRSADAPSFNPVGLTVQELENASKYIVQLVQQEAFPTDLVCLPDCKSFEEAMQHCCSTKYRSSLCKLRPCLVNGIICVGGRLRRSDVFEQQKHQIILPYRHHVTDLIINHYHHTEGHCGTLHVLASVREKYWIVKGHSAVRRVVRRCKGCKLRHAKAGSQIMGALPKERITPGNPPFTSVGVDYMGPFLVKIGKSQVKRYGCVFTCMCTRAVHIEVAHSLDTSSFINAFRRFSSRRGSASDVFSDNGTNFVGAERELREGMAKWNQTAIHGHLRQRGTNWHFNPPIASHQGGVWERVIRSIRRILQAIVGNASLTDESLCTLLAEVERILNNRPIAALSDDVRDLRALTPNMLMIGKLDCSLPPDKFATADGYRRSWRTVQWLADTFWKRWLRDYPPILQLRQKWVRPTKNFGVGDLVLVVDEMNPRGAWPKGIVEEVYPDGEGAVRSVRVRTARAVYTRDIRKLCLLEAA